MTHMLVGVDGSDDSLAALRWAATVATARGMPLLALWAWRYPSDVVLAVGRLNLADADTVEKNVAAHLRELVDAELGERAADVEVLAGRGPAASALIRAARKGATMIVVGSRGLGGFQGLLSGSVSRQLCEHAPCPVTVLRHGVTTEPGRISRIVVGTDGSEGAARALRLAGDLATQLGATVTVVSAVVVGQPVHPHGIVIEVDVEARRNEVEGWCAPLRTRGIEHEIVVVEGDPRAVLTQVVHDRAADLLIVGTRGLGPVGRLLLGSVATSLVQHAQTATTVVPPR